MRCLGGGAGYDQLRCAERMRLIAISGIVGRMSKQDADRKALGRRQPMSFGKELSTDAGPLEGRLNGQGSKMHRSHRLPKQAHLMRRK